MDTGVVFPAHALQITTINLSECGEADGGGTSLTELFGNHEIHNILAMGCCLYTN
jgi:hypothetical protein